MKSIVNAALEAKHRLTRLSAAACLMAWSVMPMTVQAETITFDELSCGAYSALDVNVYQAKNLQLFGAYCAEGKQYPNTGFYTTSGNVIFSSQNGADFPPILAATNGSTFNLASISLASAAYTNVTALITVTLADGSVITQLVPITATQCEGHDPDFQCCANSRCPIHVDMGIRVGNTEPLGQPVSEGLQSNVRWATWRCGVGPV